MAGTLNKILSDRKKGLVSIKKILVDLVQEKDIPADIKEEFNRYLVMYNNEIDSIKKEKVTHEDIYNETVKIREDIKEVVKTPVEAEGYQTSYVIAIERESFGGSYGRLIFEFDQRKKFIRLTQRQFQLIEVLMLANKNDKEKDNKKRGLLTYDQIKEKVEGWSKSSDSQLISNQVNKIRDKLGKKTFNPELIENEVSYGYRISTSPENITI
ncbi:MAG: helix-turn-helix domain-containing protein [Candidatus Omnitrophica bacterium]|nr:helix-turn-helix domain-containing protein [Candidatus Omnitrophota bacterium]